MVGTAQMRIEIGPARHMARRDTLVLASDGLSDNLHPEEIVEAVRKGAIERVADALGSACRKRMDETAEGRPGKPDDLSFIVFRG